MWEQTPQRQPLVYPPLGSSPLHCTERPRKGRPQKVQQYNIMIFGPERHCWYNIWNLILVPLYFGTWTLWLTLGSSVCRISGSRSTIFEFLGVARPSLPCCLHSSAVFLRVNLGPKCEVCRVSVLGIWKHRLTARS